MPARAHEASSLDFTAFVEDRALLLISLAGALRTPQFLFFRRAEEFIISSRTLMPGASGYYVSPRVKNAKKLINDTSFKPPIIKNQPRRILARETVRRTRTQPAQLRN